MATKKPPQLSADEIREKLARVSKISTNHIVQEAVKAEPVKRIGRKKHLLEGVEYSKIGANIPSHLKQEMLVAIATTHKDYPTIDVFVAESLKVFLAMKK